jgi:hypothetical protein
LDENLSEQLQTGATKRPVTSKHIAWSGMSSIEPDLAELARTFLVISCKWKEVVYS